MENVSGWRNDIKKGQLENKKEHLDCNYDRIFLKKSIKVLEN